MKIAFIIGARPNFVKAAPVISLFRKCHEFESFVVHTGQHFDQNMSSIFFDQLEMNKPEFNLNIGKGSHAVQTANIMIKIERILNIIQPQWIFVFGDVNSTLAAAIVAKKLNIKVSHIESGLRSFDMTMPEELNRILTDRISDLLFVTEKSGCENLRAEGVSGNKIFFVGNTMIDTLKNMLPRIEKSSILKDLKVYQKKYILVTLHRPHNVDNVNQLRLLIEKISELSFNNRIVWPIHPRISFSKLDLDSSKWTPLSPVGYIEFIKLMKNAAYIFTDSGGIQEESSFLGVPCFTLRNNTERPITCELGTNTIVSDNIMKNISLEFIKTRLDNIQYKTNIPLWDGQASIRIMNCFKEFTAA
jgi:UDP-N-acetylglucosamine 2-epimerase (non-hydrolysing)